jgi:hypothetical protein
VSLHRARSPCRPGNEKGLTVMSPFVFLGGAGRDRTDGLMNAILPKGGSVKNITYSNNYVFWTT